MTGAPGTVPRCFYLAASTAEALDLRARASQRTRSEVFRVLLRLGLQRLPRAPAALRVVLDAARVEGAGFYLTAVVWPDLDEQLAEASARVMAVRAKGDTAGPAFGASLAVRAALHLGFAAVEADPGLDRASTARRRRRASLRRRYAAPAPKSPGPALT